MMRLGCRRALRQHLRFDHVRDNMFDGISKRQNRDRISAKSVNGSVTVVILDL